MKILITGGTGRIGANIVKRLAERGDELRCVVRPSTDRLDYVDVTFPFAEFYEYDMQHMAERLQFVAKYDGKMMLEDAWWHKQGEDIGVVDVGPDSPTTD